MSHSLTKIWVHIVFSTKDREHFINKEFSDRIYAHIKNHLEKDFECFVKAINGTENHVHILILLNPNYSISELIKNVKGESSHWFNQNNFMKVKFSWQTGYGAFSVGESRIEEVAKYIENQSEHHKKITFLEEYNLFLKKYGLVIDNKNNQ
jgi:putative transposase